jgi:hypothetical protein
MNPITHVLTSWAAVVPGNLRTRDRAAVVAAGVAPDLDGLGFIVEKFYDSSLTWWSDWHHVLGHNMIFGFILTFLAWVVSGRKLKTAILALGCFHLHLLCDLLGGRGPDGDTWPIFYFWPIMNTFQLSWSGQWALNAWPNFVITGAALFWTFFWAWKRGTSPLEFFSSRANGALVDTLRRRFPLKTTIPKKIADCS